MRTLTIKSISTLLSGLVILFIILLAASCKQESLFEDVTIAQTDHNGVTLRNTGDGVVDYSLADDVLSAINYDEIVVDDELQALKFSSEDVLGTTIDIIKEANAILEAEIISSIDGLSNDEIDQMEINDYYAFEAFESHFPGFESFRSEKAQAEEAFFANDDLNDEADPALTYGAIPDGFGTVLNVYGEVITANGAEAGQQIHIARRNGANYTILSGDPGTAIDMRGEFTYVPTDPSIKLIDDGYGDDGSNGGTSVKCEKNKWKDKFEYTTIDNVQHRAHMKVAIRNSSFSFSPYHGAYSELKSRRKASIGWKKHSTNIGITQSGILRDSKDCTGPTLSANTAPSSFNHHQYKVEKTYTRKVSTTNTVGAANVVQADFDWEGQSYKLRLFY